MASAVRSVLTVGVAMVGAGAVAIAPSVRPPADPAPRLQLAAATSPFAGPGNLADLSGDSAQRIVIPPSVAAAFPQPPSPGVPTLDSAGNVIIEVYDAVEPWVQWGFELAT